MFSEKAKKHADACRFCWMCRHLCPVGLKTGKEVNTPRAKGLLVAMNERGFAMDGDTAEVMYECLLCGACTNDCVTGYDPLVFIREARTEAAVNGLTPAYAQRVIDNITETGSMYGAPAQAREKAVSQLAGGLPEKAGVLVCLGETAALKTPEIAAALLSLLKKAGVSCAVMRAEPPTGVALYDMLGGIEDVRAQARAFAQAVNATGAKTLVALDTYDAAFLRHEYEDFGIALEPEVVTATAYVAGLVKEGKLTVSKAEGVVSYHDPSRLARDLDEHEPARALLKAAGLTCKEMFQNRRLAKCCGTMLVQEYAPALTALTARGRWEDLLRTPARTLVTACPQSYAVLREQTPEGCALTDLFVLLDGLTK